MYMIDKGQDSQPNGCFAGSEFTAYKCKTSGAITHDGPTLKVEFHDMIMLDNVKGFGPICAGAKDVTSEQAGVYMYDNIVHGEIEELTDRPSDNSYNYQLTKSGIYLSGCLASTRKIMSTSPPMYPYTKVMGNSIPDQEVVLSRNEFYNFPDTTALGNGMQALVLLDTQSDYHPEYQFQDTKFVNVSSKSLAYMYTPPEEWAIITDCGDFPCTGPLNALFSFKDTVFEGDVQPSFAQAEFSIIPNNTGFSPHIDGCEPSIDQNGYICNNNNIGIL